MLWKNEKGPENHRPNEEESEFCVFVELMSNQATGVRV
jgi:hypothetical protein